MVFTWYFIAWGHNDLSMILVRDFGQLEPMDDWNMAIQRQMLHNASDSESACKPDILRDVNSLV